MSIRSLALAAALTLPLAPLAVAADARPAPAPAGAPAPATTPAGKPAPVDWAGIFKKAYADADPQHRLAALEQIKDKNFAEWTDLVRTVSREDTDRTVALAAWTMLCERFGKKNFSAVRMVRDYEEYCRGVPGYDPSIRLAQLQALNQQMTTKMGVIFKLANLIKQMPYPNDDGTFGPPAEMPRSGKPPVPTVPHEVVKQTWIAALELLNSLMGEEFRLTPTVGAEVAKWAIVARGRIIAEDQQNAYGPSRFKSFTQKYENTIDQAKVISASCLGGPGSEWLSGVAVQPDDTVCLVGSSIGPVLEVSGRSPRVIGNDRPAPPEPQWVQRTDGRGTPAVDKAGRPIYEPVSWTHMQGTGFVLRMSPDLQRIVSFHRLPWATGSITAVASDRDGNLFVAGSVADASLLSLSQDVKELPAGDQGPEAYTTDHTWIARLAPDGSAVRWIRHMRARSTSPALLVDDAGRVVFTGPDMRVFDRDGTLLNVVVVPGGLQGTVAYNPVNGTYARGGDRQSPTGHEPYRCPYLEVFRSDGRRLLDLYRFDGPFSGGATGIVADSSIRQIAYDRKGNMVLACWSDGGNTAFGRLPYDLMRGHGHRGIGMDGSGTMGATSMAHIVRLEAGTWKVQGYTLWLAYLATDNRVNGIKIDTIHAAAEDSTIITGGSAWGLIETGNSIGGGEPGGPYVAVFNQDLSSLRFSSSMPATGKVILGDRNERWTTHSCSLQGKPVAILVGSAVKEEEVYGRLRPPPAENARQEGFGGGLLDGYVLVIDLSLPPPPADDATDEPATTPATGGTR